MSPSPEPIPYAAGTAVARYNALKGDRDPYLRRARRAASLTMPFLFREEGDKGATDLPLPWSSFGAYCVHNLTSKLMLSMFPPGVPMFKFSLSRDTLTDLAEMEGTDRGEAKAAMEKALAIVERDATEEIEADADRMVQTMGILKMLVGGQQGFEQKSDGKVRGIPLERHVCYRDSSGRVLEFVVQDVKDFWTLEPDVQAMATMCGYACTDPMDRGTKSEISVYTHGYWTGSVWVVYEEVQGHIVQGTRVTYADDDKLRFYFPPFNLLQDEHYGRGYVELYEADLTAMDGLEQIVQEGSAIAALIIRMVRPGGMVDKKALQSAINGDVITGNEGDVATIRAEKTSDFMAAEKRILAATERLSKAFLLNSAVQRSGERVTAEEIRYVAQELQDQLGMVYTNLVVVLQTPYIIKKIQSLKRQRRMPRIPEKTVNLRVVTGAAALARAAQIQNVDQFLMGGAAVLGPDEIKRRVNASVYLDMRAAALTVDTEGLLYSEDEIAENDQKAATMAAGVAAAPEMVKQAGTAVNNQLQAQQQQEAPANAQ